MAFKCYSLHIILLLLCMVNIGHGDTLPILSPHTIEPLMPLSRNLPIMINDRNQKTMSDETANQQLIQQNAEILKQRTIHWELPLTLLIVAIVYFIIKVTGISYTVPTTNKKVSPEELLIHTTHQLTTLQNTQKYNEYVQHIDHTVRLYFHEITQLNTESSTTSELIKLVAQIPEISQDVTHLLQLTDNIKYAKYHATFEECRNALEETKRILHQKNHHF